MRQTEAKARLQPHAHTHTPLIKPLTAQSESESTRNAPKRAGMRGRGAPTATVAVGVAPATLAFKLPSALFSSVAAAAASALLSSSTTRKVMLLSPAPSSDLLPHTTDELSEDFSPDRVDGGRGGAACGIGLPAVLRCVVDAGAERTGVLTWLLRDGGRRGGTAGPRRGTGGAFERGKDEWAAVVAAAATAAPEVLALALAGGLASPTTTLSSASDLASSV